MKTREELEQILDDDEDTQTEMRKTIRQILHSSLAVEDDLDAIRLAMLQTVFIMEAVYQKATNLQKECGVQNDDNGSTQQHGA